MRNGRLRDWVKQRPRIKRVALWVIRVTSPMTQISNLPRYGWFLRDWLKYRRAGGRAFASDFYPRLSDRTEKTEIDPHYFHQPIWALRRILKSGVPEHVDVGSQVGFVGMLTAVTNVTFIDIRPLDVVIQGYHGLKGSLLSMPYADSSVRSLSSLHVIEHIGLGRYGDPIDPEGQAMAAAELSRILAPGGRLYLTTPIGRTRVEFNSQRVTSVEDVLKMFPSLVVVEFSYIDQKGKFFENVDPQTVTIGKTPMTDLGLGLFVLSKQQERIDGIGVGERPAT